MHLVIVEHICQDHGHVRDRGTDLGIARDFEVAKAADDVDELRAPEVLNFRAQRFDIVTILFDR